MGLRSFPDMGLQCCRNAWSDTQGQKLFERGKAGLGQYGSGDVGGITESDGEGVRTKMYLARSMLCLSGDLGEIIPLVKAIL